MNAKHPRPLSVAVGNENPVETVDLLERGIAGEWRTMIPC